MMINVWVFRDKGKTHCLPVSELVCWLWYSHTMESYTILFISILSTAVNLNVCGRDQKCHRAYNI